MPVHRFRTAEELNRPVWRQPGDPALEAAIAAVWAFGARTRALRFPPGVYKHRSIEAANEQDERWARENFAAFRARVAAAGPVEASSDRDPLFRDDVLRARRLSASDKLLEGPRLFEFSCRIILDGLRHRHPNMTDAELQDRLRETLDIVRRTEQLA